MGAAGPSVYADPVNDLFSPLVWCDVETTGLKHHDQLLEIAVLVTDLDLCPLAEPVSIVLHATDDQLEAMEEDVKAMHRASGLYDACRMSGGTLQDARTQILDYLRVWTKPQASPMCGSNIRFDRAFLDRHLPEVDQYCHYRIIDVSGVKELVRRWFPLVYSRLPASTRSHRALPDIHESIAELQFYRKNAFRGAEPAVLS